MDCLLCTPGTVKLWVPPRQSRGDSYWSLEYLLGEYRHHMEVHKMATTRGTLQTILVTGAELLENIAKLRIVKLTEMLFAASERRIKLAEAELSAPGREVAYIVRASEAFGDSHTS